MDVQQQHNNYFSILESLESSSNLSAPTPFPFGAWRSKWAGYQLQAARSIWHGLCVIKVEVPGLNMAEILLNGKSDLSGIHF